jgi:hypothetical protein
MANRAAGEHKKRITNNITIDELRLRDEKTGASLLYQFFLLCATNKKCFRGLPDEQNLPMTTEPTIPAAPSKLGSATREMIV